MNLEFHGYFVEKIRLFAAGFVKKDLRFSLTLVIMKILVNLRPI